MMLLKTTHVEIAGNRPLWIDVEFAVECERANHIDRGLRRSEYGAFVLIEQANRCRADNTERVSGPGLALL
jgi:hypothetical protein